MQAIGLAAAVDDILTIIDIIEHRFPHDNPTTSSCIAKAMIKRNSFFAIHKLPAKVLVEIIRLAASSREFHFRSRTLVDPDLLRNLSRLSRVCRMWKDIIDSTGSLWAFLAADTYSTRPLEAAIAKSGDVPVTVTLGRNQMNKADFVTMVSPLINSCRILCLTSIGGSHSIYDNIHLLVQQPSPILEELHMDGVSRGFAYRGGIGNQGDPPNPRRRKTEIWALENSSERLKVLTLRHLDWCWHRLTLPNLRDLYLSSVTVAASELIESLSGTPRLESFYVQRLTEDWTAEPPAGAAHPVPLSSLKRIEMENISTAFAHHVLSNIIPSSLEHLSLFITSFTGPVPFADASHYHNLLRSLVVAESTECTELRVGPQYLSLVVPDRDGEGEIFLGGLGLSTPAQREGFVGWISSLWVPLEPKSPLTIVLGRWGIIQPTIVPLHVGLVSELLTLDNVSDLYIGFQVGDVQLLYELLSRPMRMENGKWCWGFPKLELLLVEGQSHCEEALIQMLQARYTAINDNLGESFGRAERMETASPPSPLQTLRMVRSRRSTAFWVAMQNGRLKQIVGDEHFICEVGHPYDSSL